MAWWLMVVAAAVGWSLSQIWDGQHLQIYWMVVASFACFCIYLCQAQTDTELHVLYAAWTERFADHGLDYERY